LYLNTKDTFTLIVTVLFIDFHFKLLIVLLEPIFLFQKRKQKKPEILNKE